MARFSADPRRWVRHFRDLQALSVLFPRGSADPGSPSIIAPWLSDTVQLTFPILPSIAVRQVANPAVATNWTVTIPGKETWRLISVAFVLTTDATVASRLVVLEILDVGGTVLFHAVPDSSQTASIVAQHAFAPFGDQSVLSSPTTRETTIPPSLWVRNGFVLRSRVINFQAGDQFTAIRFYIEVWPGNSGA